ncbi:MAG: ATP synthase F1 subunit delta [Myxococcales bacterium]|nr:ATP synthase F1 subunit delta [Myxococcales bacterium]
MSSSVTARRYARALLMIGNEENRLEALTREVKAVGDVVRASDELTALLSNPVVSAEGRRAVMKEITAKLGLTPTTRNAILLLTDRRRGALIPEVADALQALNDEKAGKLQAEVTSAVPLSDAQYVRLGRVLEKLTGKSISLQRKIDPALIGGVVARIGDKVYDGSVRTRLDEIRQAALQS